MYKIYLHKLMVIMRLTTVILIATFVQVSAATFGQRVTLHEQQSSIEQVLKKIRIQTGYDFLFERKLIRDAGTVDIKLNNASLNEALQSLFNKLPLTYTIEGKIVVIEAKQKSMLDKVLGLFNEIDIKGRVLDEDGRPLRGASVSLIVQERDGSTPDSKRRKVLTMTDEAGAFQLRNIDENATIEISFTGYRPYRTKVSREVMVTMTQEVAALDQVQVIAYGSVSRRLNTATVSTVTAEVLAQQPVNNVLNALNGRMSGVQISSAAGGLPGAGISVKVRGENSFGPLGASSTDPLYVIDGIPQASGTRYDSQNFNSKVRGMNGFTNMFNSLNMDDIEQIDVLKDADATSIYGARGANGVVVITTKKGKMGRVKVNVDLSGGAGKVGHFIPMLNTQQYLDFRKEAFKNEAIEPDEDNAPDLTVWDQQANTDFQRLLLGGTARQQTANLSASGGSEFVNYYVGLNYRKEGTVISKNQHVNRLGGLMNLGFSSADRKFAAQISTNYAVEKSDLLNEIYVMDLIYTPPNFPLYNEDGSLYWHNNADNPLAQYLTRYKADRSFFSANANLSYKPFEGFTLRTTAGYTLNGMENSSQLPAASNNPAYPMASTASFGNSPNSNYTLEPQAEYILKLGDGKLTALVGTTFSEAVSKYTRLIGDNYTYDNQLGTIQGAGIVRTEYAEQKYHYASLYSRLSYDLKRRYLLNLTYRNDASSRFGTNNRLANFGSVGAAWLFSEEAWTKKMLPFLSFGKLKFSYGTTGNDRINNYAYIRTYSPGLYYQDIRTLSPGATANPDLKWENTKKLELSLSLGFLNDRILFTGNVYRNRSGNMLNYKELSSQTGGATLIYNLDAVVQNKGLELELNTRNINSGGFSWNTGFNISFERNVLLSFNDIEKVNNKAYYKIGYPVTAVLNQAKYKFNGADPLTGEPVLQDFDGKPGIGADDRYIAGLGHPFYGGLNNSFSYKGLTLDVFFKFEHKRGTVNQVPLSSLPGMMMNQDASVLNRWQESGDTGKKWPRAITGSESVSNNYSLFTYYSDFNWGNTSYIKLKTASLSYNLPQRWIAPAKFHNVKLSLQGLNLFSIAKNKYVLDPEYGYSAYPGLRTWMFGINCTL
ncbi:SusC/RagA family TonB-linked outer membrane protein [Pedobacter sp. MC2016-24]|uniref:SusC/RagA family TonB-linked outer membrane protein n=1 Tax=Pedobacter sp. MC2016-24 TaxID=2780090 RepID=UPI00187F44DF|nr:SusC/RagA family TonB-linked outer membrane protein [Pedobacter sp. MC2016-24]MBE9598035.1 SusC/RagA family TonB-linked outer membrane protein [Pedobacter sp. MC2016-24]